MPFAGVIAKGETRGIGLWIAVGVANSVIGSFAGVILALTGRRVGEVECG